MWCIFRRLIVPLDDPNVRDALSSSGIDQLFSDGVDISSKIGVTKYNDCNGFDFFDMKETMSPHSSSENFHEDQSMLTEEDILDLNVELIKKDVEEAPTSSDSKESEEVRLDLVEVPGYQISKGGIRNSNTKKIMK